MSVNNTRCTFAAAIHAVPLLQQHMLMSGYGSTAQHPAIPLMHPSQASFGVQCDSGAHSLHLWSQGPCPGCGHGLFIFLSHPPCGPQQPASRGVLRSQQQWGEFVADASHSCHVSSGGHAVPCGQVPHPRCCCRWLCQVLRLTLSVPQLLLLFAKRTSCVGNIA